MIQKINENELWLLSFYRTSEISGALFFGRLAKLIPPSQIQYDMSKHFADESLHAWYWTECLEKLGCQPLKLEQAYQDQYLSAVGIPVNLMEVLAITQVFEQRVFHQYVHHQQLLNLQPEIKQVLTKIMQDEKWHIDWVNKALKTMEPEYGKEHIQAYLKQLRQADQEVYQKTITEHAQRIQDLQCI